MTSIANTATNSAADLSRTKIMHASSTESGGEGPGDAEPPKLKGLRKRWAEKAQAHMAGSSAGQLTDDKSGSRAGSSFAERAEATASVSKVPKVHESGHRVSVDDGTSDDFLGTVAKDFDLPTSSGHKHERDALLNTNLAVFKYPWEKGRLSAIFGPEPAIKVPIPKLAPGGRNFVQVGLAVGTGGQVSSTTVETS